MRAGLDGSMVGAPMAYFPTRLLTDPSYAGASSGREMPGSPRKKRVESPQTEAKPGATLRLWSRKLFVLWDGEIRSHSRFCHHYVTSHLPDDLPARFAEGVGRFLAGNVAESPHP